MKIETPGCTNLVLPIKQKNKKDQHFVLRELDLHPIHTQMFANLWMTKGKENGSSVYGRIRLGQLNRRPEW